MTRGIHSVRHDENVSSSTILAEIPSMQIIIEGYLSRKTLKLIRCITLATSIDVTVALVFRRTTVRNPR